jgi:UDP-galactopyranose mutase
VPIPFNLDSIEALFSRTIAQRIIDKLVQLYGYSTQVPILELKTQDDPDLSFLADFVYRSVFLNYTLKQWGTKPEARLPAVTARVPIRVSRDPRYFRDTYQGMPGDGYTALVRRMLASPRIKLLLNCAWEDVATEIDFERLVFTGAIDGWFRYEHGKLPYRSLRFAAEKIDAPYFQKVGTVNYPNNFDFTRITDYNRLQGVRAAADTIVREYPDTYEEAKNDPYYPFPTDAAAALYTKYKNTARALLPKIVFLGRLGEFKYYNIDEVTLAALEAFDKYFG